MTTRPRHLSKTFERNRYGKIVIGDVLYGKGGRVWPRGQSDFQLVILHSGALTMTLDQEAIVIPERHAILLSPGHIERFVFAADRETRHSWVAVDATVFDERQRCELERYRGPIPFAGRMVKLLDLARGHAADRGLDRSQMIKFYESLALSIIFSFTSAVESGDATTENAPSALWHMERFINESYQRPLTLEQIARKARVSRQHLLKLCRLSGQETPIRQLYNKRLEVAANLLLHTGFSIAEVAEQSGFAN